MGVVSDQMRNAAPVRGSASSSRNVGVTNAIRIVKRDFLGGAPGGRDDSRSYGHGALNGGLMP
jgi:hypothetical protein